MSIPEVYRRSRLRKSVQSSLFKNKVATIADNVAEPSGPITVALRSDSVYANGSAASATVTVRGFPGQCDLPAQSPALGAGSASDAGGNR